MLTRKFINVYGFVSIGIMAVLLVLIWFELVDKSWYIPLFAVAFVIWSSRFLLRAMLVRKERREAEGNAQPPNL